MIDKKLDRRVLRTRRQLKESLLKLILVKGYDAVTIEEITAEADLGRTTFYLHYRDKEELLHEMLDAMIEDLLIQVEKIPLAAWSLESSSGENVHPKNPILLIFQHAEDNADLYRIILRGEGAYRTGRKLRTIISNAASGFIKGRLSEGDLALDPRLPLDVFSQYFAGALMGFLTWWLEGEKRYSPSASAEMFQLLFFKGAVEALRPSLPE